MKAITISGDDSDDEFETLEEALAYALGTAEPGCVISIHSEECELSKDGADENTECNCDSWDLVAGATA